MNTDSYDNPDIRMTENIFTQPLNKNGFFNATAMIGLCIVIAQLSWTYPAIMNTLAASKLTSLFNGHLYQLISTTFVHGDIAHLLSNGLMLFALSYFVSSIYGEKLFWFISLLGTTATNFLSLLTYPDPVRLIGASGLVYFLAGFWLVLYFILEKRKSIRSRVIRVLGVSIMILFPSTFDPSTSYRAHAIGLVLGCLSAWVYYRQYKRSLLAHERFTVFDEGEPKTVVFH